MISPTAEPGSRHFFGPKGLLSRWHAAYEYRPGQLQMAESIESALRERKHLVIEAGTGTGKTLAYLIPVILSGKRTVISTGTKNLQDQLFYKDIPFLQQHLNRALQVSYMKGRRNYLCRQKLYDAERMPVLEGIQEAADYEAIKSWERQTQTGDRAEIRSLPEPSSAWGKLDARAELCSGQKCQQFDRCFITLMRQRAAQSDIIIVNHHLFFADLAVKSRHDQAAGILPDYAAAVFDEAHELEDVAGQYFGISVSSPQAQELIRDLMALAFRANIDSAELDAQMTALSVASEVFFDTFPEDEGRRAFQAQAELVESKEYLRLLAALDALDSHLRLIQNAPDDLIPIQNRIGELGSNLRFWAEAGAKNYVYWIERRVRTCYLQATPIDVSSILCERLFERTDSVVLTSATLTVSGNFGYIQRRLGLPSTTRTGIVPGHFDYSIQALLYVPKQLPDPRTPGFSVEASHEILQILRITTGRAFVLFTSHQQMRTVFDRISFALAFPTFIQGSGPRAALLDEFRRTPNGVLFGTSSFWQGVDVPGDQLSCVIIDRLPFAAPNDPVVEARIRDIRESGGDAFYEYQIPKAALALKQGFGRLIRSTRDRGLLVLLDNRILNQRYGQVFLDSLPDYHFTTSIADVESFFHV